MHEEPSLPQWWARGAALTPGVGAAPRAWPWGRRGHTFVTAGRLHMLGALGADACAGGFLTLNFSHHRFFILFLSWCDLEACRALTYVYRNYDT